MRGKGKMLKLKAGNGSLVLVLGNSAYKVFRGPGAEALLASEKWGYLAASDCPIWGSHVVPTRFSFSRIATSAAGETTDGIEYARLAEFVEERVLAALAGRTLRCATEVVPLGTLQTVLRGSSVPIDLVFQLLQNIDLPSGPTHGDLHRGNMLCVNGAIRVIDLNRFRVNGCPLFDLLHFNLSEAQRGTGRPWLEYLCAHPHLAQTAAMELTNSNALLFCYAMQRMAHEGLSALNGGRPLQKYFRQAESAITHFWQ